LIGQSPESTFQINVDPVLFFVGAYPPISPGFRRTFNSF
jgi:hypothetical protein